MMLLGLIISVLKYPSDYEFMLRAFKVHQYKPYHLNKFVVNMRVGGESTKSIRNAPIGNKEVRKAWKMNNMKPSLRFWFSSFYKKTFAISKMIS